MLKKRLNIKNLVMLMIFVISTSVVIYDFVILTINIAKIGGWTMFGFITFLIAVVFMELTYEYLFETKKENPLS